MVSHSTHFLLVVYLALLLSPDVPTGRLWSIMTASTAISLLDKRLNFKEEQEPFDLFETLCKIPQFIGNRSAG
jgi:hypothetical protein